MTAPVLDAYLFRGAYAAWCPHCEKLHFHATEEGDRQAHCADPASPYRQSGYVLRFCGPIPDALRQRHERATRHARLRVW